MAVTAAQLRKIALSFPGAIEAPSYGGQPAYKIEKKFFTRLRAEDDSIVWIVDSIDERDALLELDPKTYFITDHYKDYPSVLVRIARIDTTMLRKMLERRWRAIAPKKLHPVHGGGGERSEPEGGAASVKAAKRRRTPARSRKAKA